MLLLPFAMLVADDIQCPDAQGIWMQGRGERILVMEQEECQLRGRVAEPDNQVLEVRGFWTGASWTMAATRLGRCATSAWGEIRMSGQDMMLINVRGTDGLCGPSDGPGAGPAELNSTIIYRRVGSDP